MLKGLLKGYLLTKAFRMFTGRHRGASRHYRHNRHSSHSGLSGLLGSLGRRRRSFI
jgi:hypothetical protein